MTTPLSRYQALCQAGEIQKDPVQAQIVNALEHIFQQLILRQRQRDTRYGKIRRKIKPRAPIEGLYLWGKVGTGKTFLIDLFYACLPTTKMRKHFHQFMQDIHAQLREKQGQQNPLRAIAKEIADSTVVICFDEFIVTNIADAMILSELFKALFEGGVCLIATSNTEPDQLYHNGLQRQRFLPAIEMIKRNTRVFHVTTQKDYRLRHLTRAGVYYTPLTPEAAKAIDDTFLNLTQGKTILTDPLELFGRIIDIKKRTDTAIWFTFLQICGRPRSQKDYLALCEQYETLFVSNIPVLHPKQRDLVTAFIQLIDVLYDTHTRLVLSAAAEPDALYPEGPLHADFLRTQSRLIEMRSEDYFTA